MKGVQTWYLENIARQAYQRLSTCMRLQASLHACTEICQTFIGCDGCVVCQQKLNHRCFFNNSMADCTWHNINTEKHVVLLITHIRK